MLVSATATARADSAPDGLAQAPPADAASGIEVAPPASEYQITNSILAVPRTLVLFLLQGPRYAAAGVDNYLEARSPDVGARGVSKSGWRMGAEITGETELGASLALRIGYKLARRASIDVYGGLLGPRGQSGGLRAAVGQFTAADLEPSVAVDAGRKLERIVGDTRYEAEELGVVPALGARLGPIRLVGSARFDRIENDASTDPAMPAGFGETERGITEEIAAVYDGRRRTHAWVNKAAYSTGFYVRAAAAYLHGDASRTGSFSTGRGTLEVRRLFDLFHGDRVLTLGVRGEAITDDSVPFDRLPSLGGRDRMRAFARDELRGRRTGFAELEYEWALGSNTRAYLFAEVGGTDTVHVSSGGGIRLLTSSSTALRAQAAGSGDGDFGFFLQLGAL